MTLSVAIVGTGWWGAELARTAAALPEALAIRGFCALSPDEAERLRSSHGGVIFGAYDEVLADPRVDAVVLATPHSLHVAQAIAAAKAGKHVFVEKPLGLTAASARQAVQACERHGRVLAVGHNRRFMPGVRGLKSRLDEGRCGQVLHVEANYSGNLMMNLPASHWRSQRAEMPAAGIAPMGLHMIDTLQWLLGPIARLAGISKRQVIAHDLDDSCAVLFELESGVTGTLASLLACPLAADLRLYGTAANVEARANFTELRVGNEDLMRFTDTSLRDQFAALAESCATGKPYPVSTAEAVRNVAVMEAIRRSAEAAGAWISPSSL